jgi:lon-related putative ATP-dependent protease
MGSIEYRNEMGVLATDYTMLKPGALHQANGGYLILLVKDILQHPYAWNALKRTLLDEHLTMETRQMANGAMISASLKPEPIAIDVKVILIGDPELYGLLYTYDEEFRKLFKIRADFDYEIERTDDHIDKLARFFATEVEKENLKHLDRHAVGRLVTHAARLADDQEKLTAHFRTLVDLLLEADHWATVTGSKLIEERHVEKALAEWERRNNRYEEKILEMFEDGTYLIDVTGEKVGEINGLAVVGSGLYQFGKPSKITVSTYRGRSGIINIEREARTSGAIHDKGVMILTGYLGHQFAQDKPLALTASIVFEQLYSGVDGDSASSTELYALLSSLSGVPIRQNLAVTGSVNQRGQIQPIGGVNEKIEGFFKVCRFKGLTGDQGVIIPKQNVKNLLLSEEVIEAVKDGRFHIYSVGHVNEGIELLMGKPAGDRNGKGNFPRNTINYLVDKRLKELAEPLLDKTKKTTIKAKVIKEDPEANDE